MSYTPTQWQTGDTITAEALNNMESGIAANDGYWIPVEFSGGAFSVPDNKVVEVSCKLLSPSLFIKGVALTNGTLFPGYRVNNYLFVCPFTSETVSELGIEGPAKLVVRLVRIPGDDDEVSVEFVPDTFIVTCTPTAQDFSGTMDKTVAEIDAAYRAGRKIVLRLLTGVDTYVELSLNTVGQGAHAYPSFNAICIINDNCIFAWTSTTNDGTKNTYNTDIYQLTPAT